MTFSLRTALSLLLLSFSMASFPSETKITVAFTTDVHGNFFPYDFITLAPGEGSLARVSTAVDSLRASNPGGVILLDNGDILQGQISWDMTRPLSAITMLRPATLSTTVSIKP